MNVQTEPAAEVVIETGAVITPPLNRLKASPRNARKTPHGAEAIEALAGSIDAKGLLQALVVEPERDAEGAPTGGWLVTIGEGRRQALRLLAKRKRIAKTHPVRCVIDLDNDPHEISLDENVTRTAMHPADQFEAFLKLAEERGFDAEKIATRFGVSANLVRQRLRLGAASPRLIHAYRDEDLGLDQLMAFCVSEDHARQEEVFEQLSWNRSPQAIRRAMTETKVPAEDRRAVLVGAEAYLAAGGTILRDLFTEDDGGWFENVGLLDRLVIETLEAKARDLQHAEGWKWAQAHLDYPYGHGLGRAYPKMVPPTEEEAARTAALAEEYDGLLIKWDGEVVPPEVDARFAQLDAALQAAGDREAFDPDDIARGGVMVVLGANGSLRIERGLIRPEDERLAATVGGEDADSQRIDAADDHGAADGGGGAAASEEDGEGGLVLSDRLTAELTAYRTVGLRDALAAQPDVALTALVHTLALRAFYRPYDQPACLDIRCGSPAVEVHAPEIGESAASQRIDERHAGWASRLPSDSGEAWVFVAGLTIDELLSLMAHCVSLTFGAVRLRAQERGGVHAHADALAAAVGLDMRAYWSVSRARYLDKVSKAQIVAAVEDAVSPVEAARLRGLRKEDMARIAERALAGTGWLPPLLRAPVGPGEPEDEGALPAAA